MQAPSAAARSSDSAMRAARSSAAEWSGNAPIARRLALRTTLLERQRLAIAGGRHAAPQQNERQTIARSPTILGLA
eukprot:scaffold162906_cov36-Tisochrysis_lutea.AAC.1